MIETLHSLDQQLMLWMNYDAGAAADAFWWYVSKPLTWLWLYAILLWMLVRRCQPLRVNWRNLLLLVLCTALVVLLADQISSGLIKPLVERPRPSRPDSGISELIHIVRNYRGGHYGFVSSHAANTWGVALWFLLLLRHQSGRLLPLMRCLLIAFALLNCYSRIYLGVHYPGDIIGGLAVGTLAAFFVYYVPYLHINKRINLHK
ncbi:MAG: phosphatase PAP2 family protein [Bacteroidales bacterium]|nr:phosphatase PAP2 family protein [Candidatus Liminaster caballi]